MQFNPACVSGAPEYFTIPTFTDTPANNAWTQSLINSLQPYYGVYNANYMNTPNVSPSCTPSCTPTATPSSTPPGTPIISADGNAYNEFIGLDNSHNPTAPGTITIVPQEMDAITKKKSKRGTPIKDDGKGGEDRYQGLDDEQKLKRQRRLMKNREAAQQFRLRQKEYILNLERKVADLDIHVLDNHKQIELLSTENRLLRDQLVYMYNVMRQNLSLSPNSAAPSPVPSPSLHSIPVPPAALPLPPTPPTAIDLGMPFKGFGMFDTNNLSFEEMLKSSTVVPMPAVMHPTPAITPVPSTAPSPAVTPIVMQSPITPRIAEMSLGKMELDEANAMLIARFGSLIKTGENEAQTVPDLILKPEGGANM